MIKIKKNQFSLIVLTCLFIIISNACKKDDTTTTAPVNNPTVNPLVYGSMTDYDGNTYKTIKIGKQTWMAENLKVTHYRNGEAIPNITDNTQWMNLTTGAWCYYNNSASNNTVYGKLYNLFALQDNRNIAPVGWHVPTFNEWLILLDTLGGNEVCGGKLMEAGSAHWDYSDANITNSTGFTAVPGGERAGVGGFYNIGHCGYHLCTSGTYFEMISGDIFVSYISMNDNNGYSVRLIKD